MRSVSTHWNVPGKHGPHSELFFFFLLKKEPMALSELIELRPCISAETVKTCVLIGLHMMAEENARRSDSDSSPCWLRRSALNGQEVRMLPHWSCMSTTSVISLSLSFVRTGQVK